MAATADVIRELGVDYSFLKPEKLPKTAAIIYKHAFLGLSSGSLYHAVDGDDFHGMALNSYAAADTHAEVLEEFTAEVLVAADGVLADDTTDRGLPVYLKNSSDLSGSDNSAARKLCGKIVKWLSTGKYLVHFKAKPRQ